MDFTPAELAALDQGAPRLGIFFNLQTDDPLRLWFGVGDCEPGINAVDQLGATYEGGGEISGLPAFEQMLGGAAQVLTFQLSGVSAEVRAKVRGTQDKVRGRRCYLGQALLDERWQLIGPVRWPLLTFADYISTERRVTNDPRQPIIHIVNLNVSSIMVDRRRNQGSYYVQQEQDHRSPGDRFCERTTRYSQQATKEFPRF